MIAKNNLFNIRYNSKQHWLGETGQCKGFVVFDCPEYSIRACLVVLRSYSRLGCNTIRSIVNRFSPSSENDTASYIRYLCTQLSLDADVPLVLENYFDLVVALAWFETNTRIDRGVVFMISYNYGIYPCNSIKSTFINNDLSPFS